MTRTLKRVAQLCIKTFDLTSSGFGFFGALVWLGWFAMLTGLPERIANNFFKSAPAFVLEFKIVPVLLALALTLGCGLGALGFAVLLYAEIRGGDR